MTPTAGVNAEGLLKFKVDLIAANLQNLNNKKPLEIKSEAFMGLLRLCSENMSNLKDDMKQQFMEFMQKYITEIVSALFI